MFWRLLHSSKIARYVHGHEPWALVTGASDGIGKGIAAELLRRGLNVILHGRNHTKLDALRTDLSIQFPSQKLDVLIIDASHEQATGAPAIHSALETILKGRRLTVLVNNLGYTSTYETVWEHSPESVDVILTVATRFITHITHAALPDLLQNEPSLIINVTGLTAKYPAPFLAVHSGGKAYVQNFSRALSIELNLVEPKHDVECIAVDVHNVASNSNSSSKSFFTPSAEDEAIAIIGVVGCGKRVVTGYWRHDLMSKIIALVPHSVMDKTMASKLSAMRERERAVLRERQLQRDATPVKPSPTSSQSHETTTVGVHGSARNSDDTAIN